MVEDMKEGVSANNNSIEYKTEVHNEPALKQYKLFKTNLSAYMDNELSGEENLRMKKFTINNKSARKDLEDSYSVKKLMGDSFEKTKSNMRQDFSKSVMSSINSDDALGFHPAINLLIGFTVSVLIITTFVLISLSV